MRLVVRTATLILLLAGCTTPGDAPSPSESPATSSPQVTTAPSATAPASATAVTIRKSGGIAGFNDTLAVDAQGNWTRTTHTGTRSGKLTPEQLAQAVKLATDPRLVAEAQTPPRSTTNCADALVYAVTIQTVTVTYSDCGSGTPPPAATELVRYLEQITQ